MRPSTELKPPGVYASMTEPVVSPLQVADTRIAGFVGVAQKGPIDQPQRITSWDEFLEIYGYDTQHYLSDSVEAFFRNGGGACHVVRVAHSAAPGAEPALDHANCAQLVVNDDWNKPAFRVRALDEGRWGNNIWVSVAHTTGASALLTKDLAIGAGKAQVSTTRGFQPGALVRIYDRENADFVILTESEDRLLKWSADTPVNRKHRAAAPTYLEVVEFEIQASLRERREVFKGLQLHRSARRYAPRVIAEESRLIRLEDLDSSSPPPHNLPDPLSPIKLTAGRDGSDAITPEDLVGRDNGPADRGGLLALATVDEVVQLVCPDSMLFITRSPGPEGEIKTQRVQDVMVDLCENSKDRFALLDCPRTRDLEVVKRWRRHTDSSYCAFYWPWVGVPSGDGAIHRIPPSGIMAGIYARTDSEQGVHFAPANTPVMGAVDLSLPVTEDDLGMLNNDAVNVIRLARGIRPWGVRTASSDPDWRYINVRRLFIMLRRSLEAGMTWVPFEHNDHKTWDSLRDMVYAFLDELFRKGMFAGGKPEDSFFVKCDEETNPPEAVAQGLLTCQIGVAPAIPAEFLMISVVESMSSEG